MEPEFSQKIFEKYSNIKKLMKIRPLWAELFHVDGRTDENNSLASQFCEDA